MESKQPDAKTVLKWLEKWGFPRRHLQNLDKMEGPSLDEAMRRTELILTGDCLLLVCGDRGPGKTQMATFWGREMARAQKSAKYVKAHSLLKSIRLEFNDDQESKVIGREEQHDAKTKKLLIIDEWSELAGTEWEQRTMTDIIDHRYDNLLSTVIITNHTPKEAVDAVGPSIWSRAEETGGVVVCDWPSYRKK